MTDVKHNPERSRYEIIVDGEVAGVVNYRRADTVVIFPHTEIAPSLRGQGLAARLVRAALDDVRRRNETVVPGCWFVAQFIDDHPQYHDLLAA
jgi:predicted GNAT family acetyltransferase